MGQGVLSINSSIKKNICMFHVQYSLDLLTKNVKDDSCRDIMMIGQNRCFRLTNKDIRRPDKITRRVKFEVDFS